MQSRALRILVLAWLGWWFGVFAPGHERGRFSMPGSTPADTCCPSGSAPTQKPEAIASCHGEAKDHSNSPAKGDPVARCAVCFVTARLQTPVDIAFDPPSFTLLAVLPVLEAASLEGIHIRIPIEARGPPAFALPLA